MRRFVKEPPCEPPHPSPPLMYAKRGLDLCCLNYSLPEILPGGITWADTRWAPFWELVGTVAAVAHILTNPPTPPPSQQPSHATPAPESFNYPPLLHPPALPKVNQPALRKTSVPRTSARPHRRPLGHVIRAGQSVHLVTMSVPLPVWPLSAWNNDSNACRDFHFYVRGALTERACVLYSHFLCSDY